MNDLERSFIGGIYLIPMDFKDIRDFQENFIRIKTSITRALQRTRCFLYILYSGGHEGPMNKGLVRKDSYVALHIHILNVLSSFLSDKSLPLVGNAVDIQIFPVMLDACFTLSDAQGTVLTNLFLDVEDITLPYSYERNSMCGDVAFFKCFPSSCIPENQCEMTSCSRATWTVLGKTLLNIVEMRGIETVELPDLSNEVPPLTPTTVFPPCMPHSQYKSVLLAGTFDHFHIGHQFLLGAASFFSYDHLTVAIVADGSPLLAKKRNKQLLYPVIYRVKCVSTWMSRFLCLINRCFPTLIIEPVLLREALLNTTIGTLVPCESICFPPETYMLKQECQINEKSMPLKKDSICCAPGIPPVINSWVASLSSVHGRNNDVQQSSNLVLEFLLLQDPVGPAGGRIDFECLVVTEDTKAGGDLVNQKRSLSGLPPLHLTVLPCIDSLYSFPCSIDSEAHTTQNSDDGGTVTHVGNKTMSVRVSSVPHDRDSGQWRCVSSTSIRQCLVGNEHLLQLLGFWTTISIHIDMPWVVTTVWGIRLLRHLAAPWRNKAATCLATQMTSLWNPDQPIGRHNLSLKEKAWGSICLWLISVASLNFPDSLSPQAYQETRLKLYRLITLFCTDLFWFSGTSYMSYFSLRCATCVCALMTKPATTTCAEHQARCTCSYAVTGEDTEPLRDGKYTELHSFTHPVHLSPKAELVEDWKHVPWRKSFIIRDLMYNLLAYGMKLLCAVTMEHVNMSSCTESPIVLSESTSSVPNFNILSSSTDVTENHDSDNRRVLDSQPSMDRCCYGDGYQCCCPEHILESVEDHTESFTAEGNKDTLDSCQHHRIELGGFQGPT